MSSDEPSDLDELPTPPPPPNPEDAVAPPTRTERRRLPFRRSTSDRYLAGIAGGEGRRLGLDPFYFRIGLVGVTLILARDGSGAFVIPLVAYLAAWMFWPTEDDRPLVRRLRQRPAQQEIGGAIAVFVLAIVVIGRPSLIWAGILLGGAVALLGNRGVRQLVDIKAGSASPDHGGPLPTDHPSTLAMTPDEQAASWGRSLRGAIGPRAVSRPARQRRERKPRRSPALWPLTASLLLAYGFGCVLLDNLLDPGIDPGVAVNGAILIIGGVILLSGWRGRALFTSLLLLPLAPLWVAFSVADTPRFADVGASGILGRYNDGQTLEQSKGYGGLSMTIADDELPESGEITARVSVTAGQADVWVPKEADLHIVGHIGLGQIEVYEESYYSYNAEPLVDYGLDRRYAALGRQCYDLTTDESGLRNAADWSGVAVGSKATGDEIADVVEAAGYPRPTSETVTDFDNDEIVYDPETGEPTGMVVYDEVTGDVVYDEITGDLVTAEVPASEVERTDWTYQANDNSGLCLPQDPPENPVLITIDATIGLGNLKVHRV